MNGWLSLVQRGLSPRKKRQACLAHHNRYANIYIHADKSSKKEYNFLGTLAWGITTNQR